MAKRNVPSRSGRPPARKRVVSLSAAITDELFELSQAYPEFYHQTLWPRIEDLEESAGQEPDLGVGDEVFCRQVPPCGWLIYTVETDTVSLSGLDFYAKPQR